MEIELLEVAKRYRFEWIKILSGHLTPSKGKITFTQDGNSVDIEEVYQQIAYAAPYIDLIEEFTLHEAIDFHQKFKPLQEGLNTEELINLLGFQKSVNKEVKFFSSGMKQRLKLALTIGSKAKILLLDEPTTNLDQQGMDWYHKLLEKYSDDRLLIIASNVKADYERCTHFLNIMDFK